MKELLKSLFGGKGQQGSEMGAVFADIASTIREEDEPFADLEGAEEAEAEDEEEESAETAEEDSEAVFVKRARRELDEDLPPSQLVDLSALEEQT